MSTTEQPHAPEIHAVGGPVQRRVRFPLEGATDWECAERMPRFDDTREYEVWIYGEARSVRRIGNRSMYFAPGTLVFTDCTHPEQNMLCDESEVRAWRRKPNVAGNRLDQVLRGKSG